MNGSLVRVGRWAEAMALLSRPENFPTYLDAELRMVDSIWHATGDASVDHNWYTKRVSLAVIYKVGKILTAERINTASLTVQVTELSMLEDTSEDFRETWSFLDRRFEDEVNIATFLAGSKDARRFVLGALTTAQNLVGVPRK